VAHFSAWGRQPPVSCGKIVTRIVVATKDQPATNGRNHEKRHVGRRVPETAGNVCLRISNPSAVAIGSLTVCLILMFGFEATNGFHDSANAVAIIIYTNALHPTQAVLWPAA
jgi:hypothetical protein